MKYIKLFENFNEDEFLQNNDDMNTMNNMKQNIVNNLIIRITETI